MLSDLGSGFWNVVDWNLLHASACLHNVLVLDGLLAFFRELRIAEFHVVLHAARRKTVSEVTNCHDNYHSCSNEHDQCTHKQDDGGDGHRAVVVTG